MSEDPKSEKLPEQTAIGLDKLTMDTLGEQLRTAYRQTEDKPAYLGDRALPAEMERTLVAIERAGVVHELGVAAVSAALEVEDPSEVDNAKPADRDDEPTSN